MSELRVALGEPLHGWIELTLRAAEGEWTGHCSDVPGDSLTELVVALDRLWNGDDEVFVDWSLEPDMMRTTFRRRGAVVSIALTHRPEYVRDDSQEALLFEVRGSYDEICRPFWRALRELQDRFGTEELTERWGQPFPEQRMAQLTAKLQGPS